jgi:hypothetical protein
MNGNFGFIERLADAALPLWPGVVPAVLAVTAGILAYVIVVTVARIRRREEIDRKLILKLDATAKRDMRSENVSVLRLKQTERLVG